MLNLISLVLGLGATSVSADLSVISRGENDRAPVRLWMNNDRRYRPGDHARLQVDAEADGYLLVLHFDTEGRIRVLFPLDPRDDAAVRAGRRYEVRDLSGESAFRAYGDGTGLIYTAISEDPWRFDQVTLADRWDYTHLEIDRSSANPESDITDMLQGIAGPRGFDYDVLGYRVYGESTYGYNNVAYPTARVFLYDSYYCNTWYWRVGNCRNWIADGGLAFGWGYDPYYYGYGRYGYGYGSGRYGYGGYGYGGYGYGYPYYPSRPVSGNTPVIVGRPRGYTVAPRSSLPGWNGGASRPAGDFGGGVVRAPSGRGPSGGTNVAPPARRSRPDGVQYPIARDQGNRGAAPSGRDYAPPRSEPGRPRNDPPPARPSSQGNGSSGGGSGGGASGGGRSAPPPSPAPAPKPSSGRPRP